MINVLLTGATGFIGCALVRQIKTMPDIQLSLAVRVFQNSFADMNQHFVGDLSMLTDWSYALTGQQVVIHTAAIANAPNPDSFLELQTVNVEGTLNLARQAVLAGVKRFIFISSIKVNGERTQIGKPYTPYNAPAPVDLYAISKAEAEARLKLLGKETGLEVVIIRPPMVYGPGVKGNFSTMLRWLRRGMPLPLGFVTENRRSLVALDNLVDLLVTCVDHHAAANETFLVCDGEDLSTTDLLRRLSAVMHKPAHLFPIPPVVLRTAAMFLGKNDIMHRLLGNLQVDMSHTCRVLDWKPPISVDEGLRRATRSLGE